MSLTEAIRTLSGVVCVYVFIFTHVLSIDQASAMHQAKYRDLKTADVDFV